MATPAINQADHPTSGAGSHALRAIFAAGLLCGVIDLSAAFITWIPQGVTATRLLQGISSGLLGLRSFTMGWPAAALGAALHFCIAFSAATVFYLASRKIAFLTRRPIVSGILYGVAVYVFMYWIVIPLSQAPRRPFSWSATVIAIITHIVCVGTPISLMVHRYAK